MSEQALATLLTKIAAERKIAHSDDQSSAVQSILNALLHEPQPDQSNKVPPQPKGQPDSKSADNILSQLEAMLQHAQGVRKVEVSPPAAKGPSKDAPDLPMPDTHMHASLHKVQLALQQMASAQANLPLQISAAIASKHRTVHEEHAHSGGSPPHRHRSRPNARGTPSKAESYGPAGRGSHLVVPPTIPAMFAKAGGRTSRTSATTPGPHLTLPIVSANGISAEYVLRRCEVPQHLQA